MESEHSGIFRVELVTKNVVLGSSGTHFMHMRVNYVLLTERIEKKVVENHKILDVSVIQNSIFNKFKSTAVLMLTAGSQFQNLSVANAIITNSIIVLDGCFPVDTRTKFNLCKTFFI